MSRMKSHRERIEELEKELSALKALVSAMRYVALRPHAPTPTTFPGYPPTFPYDVTCSSATGLAGRGN